MASARWRSKQRWHNEISDRRKTVTSTQIGLSSPSVTERIHKLEDRRNPGIYGLVDPKVFGLGIAAHARLRAMPWEVKKVTQLLIATPEIVEADSVTGEDCFLEKVVVSDVQELDAVIDRFQPYASADTSIILSSTVVRRLPTL